MKQQYSSSPFSLAPKQLLRGLLFATIFSLFSSLSYSQCPGNQNTSPNNSWRGYLYDSTNLTNYRGFTTENEMFEWNNPGFLWWVAPFEGSNLCDELSINYSVRYRMTKNFTAGYYTFTVGADDGFRLSIDNGATWLINEWVIDGQYDTATATVFLNGSQNLILEYFQFLGTARLSFNYTACTSTAPTSIAGGNTTLCSGSSATLTATGGTHNAGTTYQWGTGTPGSNVLAGQTNATVTVSPAATTTYWVRRYQAGCDIYTPAVTTTVTVGALAGNPDTFGNNSWNVYGYINGDLSLASAVYAGFYTQNTLGFDTLNGTNSWGNTTSPSSSAGWIGCPVQVDNFTTVHKRKGFPCGTYAITMQLWDDSSVVYIDGVQQWTCSSWSGANNCNGLVGTFNLGPNSEIEVRTRENTGLAGTTLNIVDVSVAPTAPTSLTSAGTICSGSSVTLTAGGGANGTNGEFQWGTGTSGMNIIAGETASTLVVSPTQTTTYWVRRVNTICGTTTNAKTRNINVNAATVAGSLSTEATEICRNTAPKDIVLSGNIGNVTKWQSCNNASFSGGITNINTTSTILTSAQMGTITSTKYYRAAVRNNPCTIEYTTPIQITVPSLVTYAAGTWVGTPGPNTDVVITTNLTLSSDLEVCSCSVTGISTLTVPENVTLTVKRDIDITMLGRIVIQDNGSLVQIDNNNTNSGSITVTRKTTPMKQYDYSYWSAPVQNMTLSELSPATLFDKFHSFDPQINNWQTILNGAQQMQPAAGYIVRAPQGWSMTNATNGIYEATFDGPPNNGIVPVNLIKGATTLNLIGNPYPSAIDIDLFLTDAVNESLVEGTIYLWTHNTALNPLTSGPAYANYTANDYAKYNLTGGVKTATASNGGTEVPTGKIASGQSFFIEANPALAAGTYPARFTNEMRVANNNGQFFRSADLATTSTVEKNRLWLSVENAAGSYNEMLVGYLTGATDDFDRKYDGKTFEAGNPVGLYSLLGENKLSIQGRALPFDASEIVPLGFKTTTAGNNTIKLEDADGLFVSQQAYLVDKLIGTTHDLHSGSYTFTSAAGTFHDRFELHFVSQLLDVDSHVVTDFAIATADKSIQLRSGNRTITGVTVFDISGKKIFADTEISNSLYSTPALHISNQVLMVTIEFEDGQKITRKVILE